MLFFISWFLFFIFYFHPSFPSLSFFFIYVYVFLFVSITFVLSSLFSFIIRNYLLVYSFFSPSRFNLEEKSESNFFLPSPLCLISLITYLHFLQSLFLSLSFFASHLPFCNIHIFLHVINIQTQVTLFIFNFLRDNVTKRVTSKHINAVTSLWLKIYLSLILDDHLN